VKLIHHQTSLSFVFILAAFVPVDLLTLNMQGELYLIATSHYLPSHIFVFFYADFTLFIVLLSVVCLRGGEQGTCLGPPLFGGPLEVLQA